MVNNYAHNLFSVSEFVECDGDGNMISYDQMIEA